MAKRTGTSNPSRDTWRTWWALRAPALGAPTAATAAEVWKLLGLKIRPEDLRPPMLSHFHLTADEKRELAATGQQATIVALDYCVASARAWKKTRAGKFKAESSAATFGGLFDAVAQRWSPTYRAAIERGALGVRDLKESTAMTVAREILMHGIPLGKLWEIVGTVKAGAWSDKDGDNPLYYLTRKPKKPAKVHLRDRVILLEFEARLEADLDYTQPSRALRLLPADADVATTRRPRQSVCEEIPYNVVEIGRRSNDLLDTLESTRLLFDPDAFEQDYLAWERYEQRLIAEGYDPSRPGIHRVTSYLNVYGRLRAQLREMKRNEFGKIPIRTVFFRSVNRRYHAVYLWLEHTSGKLDRRRYDVPVPGIVSRTSQRSRWFRFPVEDHFEMDPIVGRDISSSQSQVMAVFMGEHELEQLAAARSMKKVVAEMLWKAHRDSDPSALPLAETFDGPEDLEELAKRVWMTLGYGSSPPQAVLDNPALYIAETPKSQSRAARKQARSDSIINSTARLQSVLDEFPPYQVLIKFQEVCASAVARLKSRQAMRFRDPFDLADFYWNPAQRGNRPLRIVRGPAVDLSLSGKNWHLVKKKPLQDDVVLEKKRARWNRKTEKMETGPYVFRPGKIRDGRLPINKREMGRDLAPFLVHTLDAAYSALAVEGLAPRGPGGRPARCLVCAGAPARSARRRLEGGRG